MAEEVVSFVSTGATLPVGSGVVFDGVTIGASTGKVEYVKLMSGSSGSTVTVPASSNGIGAVGLNVFNTNTTANPSGVSIANGQATVSITGNVTVLFSTASTGAAIITNTTANAVPVQLTLNSSLVSTATPLPVLLQNSTATVTIQGNATVTLNGGQSTAILTTASISRVEINSSGVGGSSANSMFTIAQPFALAANSTWSSTKITSTAAVTLFSSAASTRFNIVDLVITNAGSAESVIAIYDGSTAGTKLFWTDLASAGGGVAIQFGRPRRGSSGLGIVCETIPASSVYINIGAFRSA